MWSTALSLQLPCLLPPQQGCRWERWLWAQQEAGAVQQLRALWLRLHSQAVSLCKEPTILGLFQDAGSLACQAGQEMCCLHSCSAVHRWCWAPGVSPGEPVELAH